MSARTTFGARVGALLESSDRIRQWKDPERVWSFQERFGVLKTGVSSKTARPDSFISVDDDAISSVRRTAPSGSGAAAAAQGAEVASVGWRRSRRLAAAAAVATDAAAVAADSSVHVSSSGYSSGANGEADAEGQAKNIVHYRYVVGTNYKKSRASSNNSIGNSKRLS